MKYLLWIKKTCNKRNDGVWFQLNLKNIALLWIWSNYGLKKQDGLKKRRLGVFQSHPQCFSFITFLKYLQRIQITIYEQGRPENDENERKSLAALPAGQI